MKLIDADTVRRIIDSPRNKAQMLAMLEQTPTVDAVEVVRCADCKHSYESVAGLFCSYGVCVDCEVRDDFYCAYAERRQDG